LILLDANLLIYAYIEEAPLHVAAQEWLDRQLAEADAVGFPWESIAAFIRITTNPRILQQPIAMTEATRQVERWLAAEPAWIPRATERQASLFFNLLAVPGLRSNDVPDAHLAALAIDHRLTLCSADAGFARFPRLRWMNPLNPDQRV